MRNLTDNNICNEPANAISGISGEGKDDEILAAAKNSNLLLNTYGKYIWCKETKQSTLKRNPQGWYSKLRREHSFSKYAQHYIIYL